MFFGTENSHYRNYNNGKSMKDRSGDSMSGSIVSVGGECTVSLLILGDFVGGLTRWQQVSPLASSVA